MISREQIISSITSSFYTLREPGCGVTLVPGDWAGVHQRKIFCEACLYETRRSAEQGGILQSWSGNCGERLYG